MYISIKAGKGAHLPSIQEGWRFNFPRHSKDKSAQTYILITEETPNVIEGCLIYKMKDNVEPPYMAYIEIAPHNKGKDKVYDRVAGCLIAYASRLSFIMGTGPYLGWLAFDVLEENEQDGKRLMVMYSTKYNALRLDDGTTMVIPPEGGEKLIKEYLEK